MKTNYLIHDKEYQRRRGLGWPGWDPADVRDEVVSQMAEFLGDIELPAGARVMEFGCGAGTLLLPWAKRGCRVAGVDICPSAIAWARENAAAAGVEAEFFLADLSQPQQLPGPPVDLLIDGHCLHCIIGGHRQVFLANARRHLRPDGVLHISTMCNEPHRREQYDPATRCQIVGDTAIRYFGTPEALLAEVEQAGFRIRKQEVRLSCSQDRAEMLLLDASPA